MNIKVKFGKPRFAICFLLGLFVLPATIVRSGEKPTLTRGQMLAAIENARKGNRLELAGIINSVSIGKRPRGIPVSRELLPDFVSFLKDKDVQVQLLGAVGLYKLESPTSKTALVEYLRGKDLAKMEKRLHAKEISERNYGLEMRASSMAIMSLGKIGDESVIPLLESLRGIKDLKFEWGGGPVAFALAELGAVKTLANVPPDSDDWKIWRACYGIGKIRDPNKVPELKATVYNENCAIQIRNTALDTLGKINVAGNHDFLLGVIKDTKIPMIIRGRAVITAARTGDEMFEETFLSIANSDSEIRAEGFYGLAILKPDKYMKNIFEKVRDVNEPDDFRETLAGRSIYVTKKETLINQKDELYACLNTKKTDDSPHDRVRIVIWRLINELFGDQPSIILTNRSYMSHSAIKSAISRNIRSQWRREPWNEPSVAELLKMVDERFKQIVTILDDGGPKR